MTTCRRKSPEQSVRMLGPADHLLANGEDPASVCRTLGISEARVHGWRARYDGINVDDAKWLKELEEENTTLKRLMADSHVEKAALKAIARAKW